MTAGVNVQETEDIRPISDVFAADGNAVNTFGLSNMVWGFGQFLGVLSHPHTWVCVHGILAVDVHSGCAQLVMPTGMGTAAAASSNIQCTTGFFK